MPASHQRLKFSEFLADIIVRDIKLFTYLQTANWQHPIRQRVLLAVLIYKFLHKRVAPYDIVLFSTLAGERQLEWRAVFI